jgi:tetratricopeptide (TPR) repeat protein
MLLGLFDLASIAWYLVEEVAQELNFGEGELRAVRKQLNNLYLLKAVDGEHDRFTVHSLVREFMKWKLAQTPTTNHTFRTAFVTYFLGISKTINQTPTKDQIEQVAPAIPHLELLSREMIEDIPNPGDGSNLAWTFFIGIARFYEGQGLYTLAEDPYQRCLSSVQEILGDRHPDVAASLNNLAELYQSQGRYKAAESLYQKALALRQELLGDRHPDVAASLNNLASLYYSQGRYAAAEPLYLQTLEICLQCLGEDHPNTQTVFGNFRYLLQQALANGSADSLSPHPLTQQLLREMRE